MGLTTDEMFKREQDTVLAEETATWKRERLRDCRLRLKREDRERIIRSELKTTRAWKAVRQWASSDARALVLSGNVGTGKTLAAVAWAIGETVDAGRRFDVVSAPTLGELLHPTSSEDVQKLNIELPCLVVDDVGTEQRTPRWVRSWMQLVDARERVGRTIYTTNLSKQALVQAYDARTLSRLQGSAIFVSVGVRDDASDPRGMVSTLESSENAPQSRSV